MRGFSKGDFSKGDGGQEFPATAGTPAKQQFYPIFQKKTTAAERFCRQVLLQNIAAGQTMLRAETRRKGRAVTP